jgi:hypothetical protein
MTVRADYEEGFFRKFLLIALVCFAYSIWCLYDGWIAYPAKLQRAEVYHTEMAPLGEERSKAWIERTEKEGWPQDIPKEPAKIENDIVWQYIQIGICLLVGVPLLLKYLMARGSYIEADGQSIRPSWRSQPVPLDAITKIDKSRWKKKGIAKLFYQVDGQTYSFVMDDFKFARQPMSEIMSLAERNLPDTSIVGPREATS